MFINKFLDWKYCRNTAVTAIIVLLVVAYLI